jgi:hypothetical protein
MKTNSLRKFKTKFSLVFWQIKNLNLLGNELYYDMCKQAIKLSMKRGFGAIIVQRTNNK